jgi:hypothetical protein
MNVLLINDSTLLASVAPSKMYQSSVVCFEDSCYLMLKKISSTFRVDVDPTIGYGFGNDSVAEGLRKLIDGCQDEEELKTKLKDLLKGNETCIIKFADYKKIRIKGFLKQKTFSARQNALRYISFSVSKDAGKELIDFYPNI